MKLRMRRYQSENDFWTSRAFLREVYLQNGRRELSWHVARWDYWRWHCLKNCGFFPAVDDVVFLWETPEGQLGALVNPEGPGEAFLHVAPEYSSAALEEEMIEAAQEHLAVTGDDDRRHLTIWASEHESIRQQILENRGYSRGEWSETQRQRRLDTPLPEAPLPDGYAVRALLGEDELPARSWASWRAFHEDDPDEDYDGWDWYRNVQSAPLYRRDLDVVAIAPDGSIAAFCTLWYDDVTRSGYFEPVGTTPEHRRRGLGKAVMVEAMRRVQRMGGVQVVVGGYTGPANSLYRSVVSEQCERYEPWIRAWDEA